MFIVRKFRQIFNVSQNFSDVFARLCHASAANDTRIHSGFRQKTLVFPRIQAHININHKFSFRDQSFTSLKVDLRQDKRGGFAFSRCLNGTFP